ncbi:MAG: flavin reductase [Alphaproteobacteria bacterium]|nr:flavin reductase [Alphaproteobacteria bacterium]
MQADAKKTTLRMIPYGIYVLTAADGQGNVGAATVNWVTQTAFAPPLVAVGVKTDSGTYGIVKAAGTFALNMLGKDHKGLAFTFFKPAKVENGMLSGQAYAPGANGAPILQACIGAVECKVAQVVELGDHHIFVGEVTEAHLRQPPTGRPDHAILAMSDLGDTVFYGG